MRQISHREYLAKLAWMDHEMNHPSDSLGVLVHYLMQIAAEVRRVLAKRPKSIKLEHFKLRFGRQKAAKPMTVAEATKQSKSRWRSALNSAMAITKKVTNRLPGMRPKKAERK